jgi:S-adenosyl methyltransferase
VITGTLLTGTLGTGRWREEGEVLSWFGDWELIEPGLVPLAEWRSPERGYVPDPEIYHSFSGGVVRKR